MKPILTLALLLSACAGALPDPAKHPRAYERYTHGQFVCDDHPEREGCGNEPSDD